jgi:hypothetical protein
MRFTDWRKRLQPAGPIFRRIISATSLLFFLSGNGLFAAEAVQPFAAFGAKVEIDIEDGEVEVWANFTLGASGNGIDPAKEDVALQVTGGSGTYSVTLPAGSFKAGRSGEFSFKGTINKVKMIAAIRPSRGGAYEFEIQTESASLKGFSNPVALRLTIGDDGGNAVVKAKIE